MVYLRSEEHLRRWLGEIDREPGATLTATKMNELSRGWWGTRLDSGWLPRPPDESQAILDGVDLSGEFWALR